MAISGNFSGSGLALINQPWFERRWQRELEVLAGDGPESVALVEVYPLDISTRFPRQGFFSFLAILQSKRGTGQHYAVETVLPANWPWGEPVSYIVDPEIRAGMTVYGHAVPHIYGAGDFNGCLCTHVGEYDTGTGKTTLTAYLFAVAVWWACFEEFMLRGGNLDYHAWSRAADYLLRYWGYDWSRGVPVQ